MLGKKVISILLCSLVAFGSMTSVAYAKNDDSIRNHNVIKKQINNNQKNNFTISEENEESLKAFLRENSVSEENIQELIDKLNHGEVWDSLKEEYSDIKPVSTKYLDNRSIQNKYISRWIYTYKCNRITRRK